MSTKLNLKIEQGTTFRRVIGFSTPEVIVDGVVTVEAAAIDISNDTFAGQIRTSVKSADVVEEFTFEILQDTGTLMISLTAEQTASFNAAKTYVYDCERTLNGNGDVQRFLQGTITISAEVTREVV